MINLSRFAVYEEKCEKWQTFTGQRKSNTINKTRFGGMVVVCLNLPRTPFGQPKVHRRLQRGRERSGGIAAQQGVTFKVEGIRSRSSSNISSLFGRLGSAFRHCLRRLFCRTTIDAATVKAIAAVMISAAKILPLNLNVTNAVIVAVVDDVCMGAVFGGNAASAHHFEYLLGHSGAVVSHCDEVHVASQHFHRRRGRRRGRRGGWRRGGRRGG